MPSFFRGTFLFCQSWFFNNFLANTAFPLFYIEEKQTFLSVLQVLPVRDHHPRVVLLLPPHPLGLHRLLPLEGRLLVLGLGGLGDLKDDQGEEGAAAVQVRKSKTLDFPESFLIFLLGKTAAVLF